MSIWNQLLKFVSCGKIVSLAEKETIIFTKRREYALNELASLSDHVPFFFIFDGEFFSLYVDAPYSIAERISQLPVPLPPEN